eukprot:7476819-Lingulodinium_polyedra.AAC.1
MQPLLMLYGARVQERGTGRCGCRKTQMLRRTTEVVAYERSAIAMYCELVAIWKRFNVETGDTWR